MLLSVLAPLSSLKEDILRHRLFIDSDQMPTWVHYCFCLIMQLVYIPVDSPGLCGSLIAGRTFFVNICMYSWHFFCLFQVCLIVIDIFKYLLKNCLVNENF